MMSKKVAVLSLLFFCLGMLTMYRVLQFKKPVAPLASGDNAYKKASTAERVLIHKSKSGLYRSQSLTILCVQDGDGGQLSAGENGIAFVELVMPDPSVLPIVGRVSGKGIILRAFEDICSDTLMLDRNVAQWSYEFVTAEDEIVSSGKTPVSGEQLSIDKGSLVSGVFISAPPDPGNYRLSISFDNRNSADKSISSNTYYPSLDSSADLGPTKFKGLLHSDPYLAEIR